MASIRAVRSVAAGGLAVLLCAAAIGPRLARAEPRLPQQDGRVHLGASTCRGPVCHSSVDQNGNVRGDEWYFWHDEDPGDSSIYDRHSRAYKLLENEKSKRIMRNLGRSESATKYDLCLDCHSDNVPKDKRGKEHKLSSGVGCEACHGGSELWAKPHDSGRPHAQNVADGMYPADDPVARAALCTSCHFGNKDKFVTHRIMGAGHPRLRFELDVYTNTQPAHFVVDDDYRKRGKKAEAGAKVWAIGQAMSVRASLDALLDPKRARDGAWPELVLFDCHACHHAMSEQRWRPGPSTSRLGPGRPRLNDSSFVMVRYAFGAVDPAGAKLFFENLRELHVAASESEDAKRAVATRMRGQIDGLIPKLAAWKVDASAVRGVLRAMLADGKAGYFLDYAGAEQAALTTQSLFESLYVLGAVSDDKLTRVAAENEKLLAVVENPEKYDRAKAVAVFGRLEALVP